MNPVEFDWEAAPLSAEEQAIVDAYVVAGKSVDELPYTPEFEQIIQQLRLPDTDEARQQLFRSLLRLRKTGRLPRVRTSLGV